MANLSVGYLFKKKYITYQSKKWEMFEFVDYVTAISFTNTSNNERCNILSGNNAGSYASVINKNANEEDFVFISDNLSKAIEENENSVNFVKIRENKISRTAKYYLRKDSGDELTQLVNNDLISFLEKDSSKSKSEFDEGEFEKSTDISTMYSSINPIVSDGWQTAVFDITNIESKMTDPENNPYLWQFHLHPFGSAKAATLTENDIMYIGNITFSVKAPDGYVVETGTVPTIDPTIVAEGDLAFAYTEGAFKGVVDRQQTATTESNVIIDGKNTVKITPNPMGADA